MTDTTPKSVELYHRHHIVPRHAGGSNEPSNIIELTVEDHAEAHRQLWLKHGRWQDKLAWRGLSGNIGKEEIRREILSRTHKGKKLTPEHLEKLRKANTGRKRVFTEEHKQKLRDNHANVSGTQNPSYGRKHSADVRAKLSQLAKTRKRERNERGQFI